MEKIELKLDEKTIITVQRENAKAIIDQFSPRWLAESLSDLTILNQVRNRELLVYEEETPADFTTEELIDELLSRQKLDQSSYNYLNKEDLLRKVGVSVNDILPHRQRDYLCDIFELHHYSSVEDILKEVRTLLT